LDSLEVRVYFPQGKSELLPTFRNNDLQLTTFTTELRRDMADTTKRLQDITIYTGASPEGKVAANLQLSIDRGTAVKNYIQSALSIPDSVFVMVALGEDWERLADMVRRYRVPSWERILEIIDEYPDRLEERKRKIKEIDNGRVWKYLLDNVFPELRGGDNYIACHFSPTASEAPTMAVTANTVVRDTLYVFRKDTVVMVPNAVVPAIGISPEGGGQANGVYAGNGRKISPQKDSARLKTYQFALKTNLLMDLGTALNVELEFPIGKHWSVMAEHWFPWWTFWSRGYSYTLQVLQTSVEGRYWFGDRIKNPVLSGFFLGAYAGAACFDVEWKSKGIQGETFINTGLSFGYSFNIGRNWRFETSISAGYFRFDGRTYYHDDYWKLRIWEEDRTINWIGPTKLKCSISWLIPIRSKSSNKGRKEDMK